MARLSLLLLAWETYVAPDGGARFPGRRGQVCVEGWLDAWGGEPADQSRRHDAVGVSAVVGGDGLTPDVGPCPAGRP